jgi:hypothetical protein
MNPFSPAVTCLNNQLVEWNRAGFDQTESQLQTHADRDPVCCPASHMGTIWGAAYGSVQGQAAIAAIGVHRHT